MIHGSNYYFSEQTLAATLQQHIGQCSIILFALTICGRPQDLLRLCQEADSVCVTRLPLSFPSSLVLSLFPLQSCICNPVCCDHL